MTRTQQSSWQTTLADLSLILFMIALAALVQQADGAPAPALKAAHAVEEEGNAGAVDNPLPAEADAVAVYRPLSGAVPLAQWLDDQGDDPRLQLTVIARYSPAEAQSAAASAMALAAQANDTGHTARIVLEPLVASTSAGSRGQELVAVLAYDRPVAGQ